MPTSRPQPNATAAVAPSETPPRADALSKESVELLAALHAAQAGVPAAEGEAGRRAFPPESADLLHRRILDRVGCGILLLDGKGMVLFANQGFCELVGAAGAGVLGRPFREFATPEMRPVVDLALKEMRADGASTDLRLSVGEEQSKTVRLVLNRLVDGVLCAMIHDLTDRQIEAERLQQAERLAAIGQMLTVLSHETRNALQRSLACIDMALRRLDGSADIARFLTAAREAQMDVHRLLNQVREYAAPIHLERHLVDLQQCWREAWDELAPQRAGREAELAEATECASREGYADPFLLRQVFRNLMENSLAAAPDPVRIDVTCSDDHLAGRPAIRIQLHDNGPGVSAELAGRLFEPFFTTRPKGTGLGMAIVKRTVEAHDGRISLDPGTGTGLSVSLTFPRGQS